MHSLKLSAFHVRFSESTVFRREYYRTHAAGGRQNLRCFPQCSFPIHREHGYCGNSVFVEIVQSMPLVIDPAMLHVFAKFEVLSFTNEPCNERAPFQIGDTIDITAISANLRSPEAPMNTWFASLEMENSLRNPLVTSYLINFNSSPWHYGWNSREQPVTKRKTDHQLSVLCFIQDPNNVDKYLCINKLSSPSFRLVSTRGKRLSKQLQRERQLQTSSTPSSGKEIAGESMEKNASNPPGNKHSEADNLQFNDKAMVKFSRQLCCIVMHLRKFRGEDLSSPHFAVFVGGLFHFMKDDFVFKLQTFFNDHKLAITKGYLLIQAYRDFLFLLKTELDYFLNERCDTVDRLVLEVDPEYLSNDCTLGASYPILHSSTGSSSIASMKGFLLFASQMRQVFVICVGKNYIQPIGKSVPVSSKGKSFNENHKAHILKAICGQWKCRSSTTDFLHHATDWYEEPILGIFFMKSLKLVQFETTPITLRFSSKYSAIPSVVLEADLSGGPSYAHVGLSGILFPIGCCGDYRTFVTDESIVFESFTMIAHKTDQEIVCMEKFIFRINLPANDTFDLAVSVQKPGCVFWVNKDRYYSMNAIERLAFLDSHEWKVANSVSMIYDKV